MGLYACFLAGSNYFAPVICGFIAEHQGWEWVFYWPSIFCAVALVFLFFFMEETNYARDLSNETAGSDAEPSTDPEQVDKEKAPHSSDIPKPGTMYTKKSYLQKLSLLGPRKSRNNMLRRSYQTLYYLTWPVVFYAG